MKTKFLTLILLTAILLTVTVSAVADYTVSIQGPLSKEDKSIQATISTTNTTGITVDLTTPQAIDDGFGHTIPLTLSTNSVTINQSNPATVTISYTGDVDESFALGTLVTSLYSQNQADSSKNRTDSIEFLSSYCEFGNVEDEGEDRYLEIRSIKDESSEDEWEWKPGDEVEVEVKVKFVNKDDDNDDIDAMIQVRLYDTEENEFVDLETDEDDLEVEISLDEGETVEEKFLLELPVEDIDDSSDRYRLYVKVYEDGDEEVVCRDYEDDEYFKEVKIDKESYEVILKDLEVTTPVPCGEEVEVIVRAHNIGKNDEDKVMVTLFNSELDIDLDSREFSLDEGDSEKVTFSFLTPEDAEEKTYTLKAYTMYRYKESTEAYREESEAYELALKIEGNCEAPEDEFGASIDAELGSESVVAGEELVILGTLENTGEQETTYVLSVEGYDSWAELDDIEPRTITLEAGEQEDFEVTFMVKEDTEGENFFTIVAEFEDQEEEQEVSVVVEAVSDVTGEAIAEHLRKNWFIWVIVVINVILIIAIIIVARRIVAAR